jgi:peptidoglycan/LPS O-acetylase OafA/YrhL
MHFDGRAIVQAGFLGVELFFFISGFCLMLPYAASMCGRRTLPKWGEYWSRRFWKIVPSYYLALGVAACFPIERPSGVAWPQDLLLHATFMHSFSGPSFVSLNSNFWSLAVEVQFYLFFPLIVWSFMRAPVATAAGLGIVGLAYSNAVASAGLDGTFQWSYQLLGFLPLFALGSLCAWIHERFIRDRELCRKVRMESAVVASFALVAVGYVFEQVNRTGGGPVAWVWQNAHRFELGVVFSLFTLSAASSPIAVQRLIANPVLTFLSNISYNMYLWNGAVVSLVASRWAGDAGWRGGVFAFLVVAGASAAGFVLTVFFERPLMRHRLDYFARVGSWAALALHSLNGREQRSIKSRRLVEHDEVTGAIDHYNA